MIYAELSGGLGNQMFVYAFARAMGLCCQEPVTLIDRQDWKTGSPAHTALALQALHISSEVQFITDAGFAKQHLPVQNAAKALMIRHEQRAGLMDRDWHPFEARMAPMLNAIGLHFATEGFTPAKRGHAKNFLAWGYFQGADYFKDQAETIRAELLPIENPEHGFTAAAAAFAREIEASPFPVCLHWRCGDYLLPQRGPAGLYAGVLRRRLSHGVPKPAPGGTVCLFRRPRLCAAASGRCGPAGALQHRGKKCRGGPCPDAPLPGVCAEQLHLQLVGAVAGRCAGPLCDRAGPLVRQRQKDRPV